ncbi:MAG: hypothetical protein FWH34_01180, partial [Desulfovibrionaceae bacterium]|nr:hypothetical protein [Desulfovibrionaceae bacterium]
MFFEWPDLRLIRNPSFLERVLQRLVYTNKKYVLIPDDITAVRYKWSYFGVIPTSHLFARPHSHGEVFWDRDHLGPNGYRVVSKFMFELICEFFDREHNSCALLKIADFERISAHEHFIQHNRNLEEALTYYTKSHFIFKMKEGEIAGCVVMNCNPFSFGHKFLIDYALSKVDYLYIFVVEEDKSFFSFEHRLYLLHNHYKNNNNIKVIPSGRLILSSLTFPTYFDKDNKKEGEADLLLDINIFCTIIKSIFNISYRFVGTEPYCNVTRQYNSALRETLPKYGIEYCEIERKDIDGIPISATNIRQYIKIKDFTALQKLVPKVTFDLIKTLYAK